MIIRQMCDIKDAINMFDFSKKEIIKRFLIVTTAVKNYLYMDQDCLPSAIPHYKCYFRCDDSGKFITLDEFSTPYKAGSFLSFCGGDVWIRYLINNFFIPWRKTLNGEIHFLNSRRKMIIENNVVRVELL